MSFSEKCANFIVKKREKIGLGFLLMLIVSLFLSFFVEINYDLSKYLPDWSLTEQGIHKMEETFGYPGTARVMIKNVTMGEALNYKNQIEEISGVDRVSFHTGENGAFAPNYMEGKTEDLDYKDGNALFHIVFVNGDSDLKTKAAVQEIEDLLGDKAVYAGLAVQSKTVEEQVSGQMGFILGLGITFIFLILLLMTNSYGEPILFLLTILVAVGLNRGTNVFLGKVSFITNNVAAILQIAVSMDYAIFLLHSFELGLSKGMEKEKALSFAVGKSLNTILASSLTTVGGFLALCAMQFGIGMDMGLVLAKGVVLSLLTVIFFMPALLLRMWNFVEKTRHKSFLPSFHSLSNLAYHVSPLVLVLTLLLAFPLNIMQGMNNFRFSSSAVVMGEGTKISEMAEEIDSVFGEENLLIAIYPSGRNDMESALGGTLKSLPFVKSVQSLSTALPEGVPEFMTPKSSLDLVRKDGYSRMVITLNLPGESEASYKAVNTVRQILKDYTGSDSYLVGDTTATMDMENILRSDNARVNTISLIIIFLVVMFSFKSALYAFVAMVPIEMAIMTNMSFSYLEGSQMIFIGFVVVSSIQLGATVDYAILALDHFKEEREKKERKEAISAAIRKSLSSLLVSGSILTVVGYVIYFISSVPAIGQLGKLIGRGALCSLFYVVFLLPGLLRVLDKALIRKEKIKELVKEKREKLKESEEIQEKQEVQEIQEKKTT